MNNNMFSLKLSLDQGTHGIYIFSFYRKTKRQKCFTKTGCWEELYCYKVKKITSVYNELRLSGNLEISQTHLAISFNVFKCDMSNSINYTNILTNNCTIIKFRTRLYCTSMINCNRWKLNA